MCRPSPGMARLCRGGAIVLSASFFMCGAALLTLENRARECKQGEKLLKVRVLFSASSGFHWINSTSLPIEPGCESSALGEGVEWNAQVAHRYVFCFCAYQQFTHQVLFCPRAEKPHYACSWESEKWEAAVEKHCAKCPASLSRPPRL